MTGVNKNCKGVTLLEILIAISIFAVVATGAVNLFSSLIKSQKRLLDKAYVLSTLSYSVEYMSKALRMAQKDIAGNCIGSGENFILTPGPNIKFLNSNGDCQEFFLEGDAIKVRKLSIVQNLTPANIIIESLNFSVLGGGQVDNLQPKITFTLKARALNSQEAPLLIQTTVSQRMLDFFY